MRIYYSIKNKHLIAVPLRNGTSYLGKHLAKYELTEITHLPLFQSVLPEVQKKTFLYRDPFLRITSFYQLFIYEPYITKKKLSDDSQSKLFAPPSRGNNLFADMWFARNRIIENYKNDWHTSPQYTFFESEYEQSPDKYEFISVTQYAKWLKLTFADMTTKQKPSPIDDIILTPSVFVDMSKIHDLCKELYAIDYEFFEPRITYL